MFDFDENDYVGAYVQDEWKLRQNLTLNVGVRWKPYLPIKNSLGKTVKVAARNFQFRWEVFNVLNHASFNNPTTALNSPTFGRILSAADPRIMQFAFKYDF